VLLHDPNCSNCCKADGSEIKGAFPTTNGSSIVQEYKETLTKKNLGIAGIANG
jgi:hypothetical protein